MQRGDTDRTTFFKHKNHHLNIGETPGEPHSRRAKSHDIEVLTTDGMCRMFFLLDRKRQ